MALFFDQDWFDERLKAAGLGKSEVARALGISDQDLAEMWKDQREISEQEIKTLAMLLAAPEAEVKKRGGLQGSPQVRAALDGNRNGTSRQATRPDVEARLDRIERLLEEILKELKVRS